MHHVSIRQISKQLDRNYSTIYNIVMAFIDGNHTNRMRNYKEKTKLLRFREQCKQRRVNIIKKAISKKLSRFNSKGVNLKFLHGRRAAGTRTNVNTTYGSIVQKALQSSSGSALSLNLQCPLMLAQVEDDASDLQLKMLHQPKVN